jgi:shikimate kinase
MNVVLIGLRGAGKTTVGRLVAARLQWRYLDTDAVIQERAGETISAIFARGGERLFRSLEADAVRDSAANDRVVLSCGGGVVLDPRNVEALRRNGLVVHLIADPEELWRRVSADASSAQTRPTLIAAAKSGVEELRELARARAGAYAQARHAELPVGGRTPDQVADAVLELMRAHGLAAAQPAGGTQ